MATAFAEIAFTDAVKALQERQGSRASYARFEADDAPRRDRLTAKERAFIMARDGFYQASVTAEGWPYVQYRGGPAAFLSVLDERTIAYADFSGNRQYLSAGNLTQNDRIVLILMDYAGRRRLKLWGRAKLVEAEADPLLIDQVAVPDYPGAVERAVVISIEAFDWNCPQHITRRFSAAEVEPLLAPLRDELEALRAENAQLRAALPGN
jgi:uncharacterized protein